jgi:hypothetical protein
MVLDAPPLKPNSDNRDIKNAIRADLSPILTPITCTVVATFEPFPEHRESIKKMLLEQAAIVREEPGCEYYDLYDQVNGDLVFVEA